MRKSVNYATIKESITDTPLGVFIMRQFIIIVGTASLLSLVGCKQNVSQKQLNNIEQTLAYKKRIFSPLISASNSFLSTENGRQEQVVKQALIYCYDKSKSPLSYRLNCRVPLQSMINESSASRNYFYKKRKSPFPDTLQEEINDFAEKLLEIRHYILSSEQFMQERRSKRIELIKDMTLIKTRY